MDDRVLQLVVDWDPGARLNPLVPASILFGPMSVVLAAVTPIAVRIAALDVATLGRTAGRLFAVSTVGSIVGTFATAFVLIPELGTNQLLALGAAVLLAGTALVGWIASIVVLFVHPSGIPSRIVLGCGWLLLLAALAAGFNAQAGTPFRGNFACKPRTLAYNPPSP